MRKTYYYLIVMAMVALGVSNAAYAGYPGDKAMPADVDFDWMLATVDEFKNSEAPGLPYTRFYAIDNDGNGIYEDDNLAMLSAILMRGRSGYTGVQYLDQTMCAAIQSDFNYNRRAAYSDLEVRNSTITAILNLLGYSHNAVDLITEFVNASLGNTLLDLLGGWATIADSGMLSGNSGGLMNRLIDDIINYFADDLGYPQYASMLTDDFNFEESNYHCWGDRAKSGQANRLGAAGDVDFNVTAPLTNFGNNLTVYNNYGPKPPANSTRENFLTHCNISPPLRIVTHPAGKVGGGCYESGDCHTFNTTCAGGQGNKLYRWCYYDDIQDEPLAYVVATYGPTTSTSNSYPRPYLTHNADDHRFVVVVSDSIWMRTSAGAELCVNDVAFQVTQNPATVTKYEGTSHTFTVNCHGGVAVPNILFQFDNQPINGVYATVQNWTSIASGGKNYTINPLQQSHAGNYQAGFTDGSTTLWSTVAGLSVTALIPHIDINPTGFDVYTGAAQPSGSMTVTVSGATPPYTYQWQKYNGSSWVTVWTDGPKTATTSTYAIGTSSPSLTGDYRCHVIESYVSGSADTTTAHVQIDNHLSIATPPAGGDKYVGQNVPLTVVLGGGKSPINYQWKKGPVAGTPNTNVGSNSATLALNNIQTSDQGSYNVVVTDRMGETATSTPNANIYVYAPIVITTPPAGGNYYTGSNHQLKVVATGGKGSRHYQWKKNGTDIPSATSDTWQLNSLTVDDTGTYTCLLTDDGIYSLTTTPVDVNVAEHILITDQPDGGPAYVTESFTFNITATGGYGTRLYQWFFNGNLMAGRTSPTLELTDLKMVNAGSYVCRVSDQMPGGGEVINSDPAILSVYQPVRITNQPTGGNYYGGASHAFTVTVTGGLGTLHYQWFFDNGSGSGFLPLSNASGHISGVNTATLLMSSVVPADTGNYRCQITDDGTANKVTNSAALQVASHMYIGTHPAGANLAEGGSHTMSVTAVGGIQPILYQWRLNGTDITGATAATLPLTNVAPDAAGSYTCYVRDSGTDTQESNAAVVTVLYFSTQPEGAQYDLDEIEPGTTHTFSVVVAGGAGTGPTYVWYHDGVVVSGTHYLGANSATLTIKSPLAISDSGNYWCVATRGGVSATSVQANLVVARAPIRFNPALPAGASIYVGGSTTLQVEIPTGGTAPFTYQWRKDGVNIAGAVTVSSDRTNSYTLTDAELTDAGAYTCYITDTSTPQQNATSPSAQIQVFPLLAVTQNPTGGAYYSGDGLSHTFTVSFEGGIGAKTLQWQKKSGSNWNNLPSATGSSYQINNLMTSNAGVYRCMVMDAGPGPDVPSGEATLTVRSHLSVLTQPTGGIFYTGDDCTTMYVITTGGILSPMGQIDYQWYKDGAPINGATGPSIDLTDLDAADSATYMCVLTDYGTDSVDSDDATVEVYDQVSIVNHPIPGSYYVGENVAPALIVEAAGGKPPLSYQWRKDGVNITTGGNAQTLVLNNLQLTDGASYSCVVTDNDTSSATSNAAEIQVWPHLTISAHPTALFKQYTGGSAILSVTATGGKVTRHYQWKQNGSNVNGATGSTLTLNPIKLTDAGTYVCEVTDDGIEKVTSNASLVRVADPMFIDVPPVGIERYTGDTNLSLNVQITGGMGTVSYQWRKDTVNRTDGAYWTGCTTSTVRFPTLGNTNAGSWDVRITDELTSIYSTPVTVKNVMHMYFQTNLPSSIKLVAGDAYTLTVVVPSTAGIGAKTYQWYKDGAFIPGATNSTYPLSSVAVANAGQYYCIVTDQGPETRTSNKPVMSVLGILQQPDNTTVSEHSEATLTCVGDGGTGGAYTYQWFKDDGSKVYQPITSATSSTYTIPDALVTDSGDYHCVVSEGGLSITSNPAHLSVTTFPPPEFTTQPLDKEAYEGQTVTLSVVVTPGSGTPFTEGAPYLYQWRFKSNESGSSFEDIPGATSASWTSPALTLDDAGQYRCNVTDKNVTTPSGTAIVTIWPVVKVDTPPVGGEYYVGGSASMSVAASGGHGTLYYQWKLNNVSVVDAPGHITGANTDDLQLTNMVLADAGAYTCTVTDAYTSSATSAAAQVEVAPVVSATVASQNRYAGDSVNFLVAPNGGYPDPDYTYQWYKDAGELSGKTGESLELGVVDATDAGEYSCKVSDKYTFAMSNVATLTVSDRISITDQPDDASLVRGETFTATVVATGGYGSLHYQWLKDGVALDGQVAPVLTLNLVSAADAGVYTCVITDDSSDTETSDEAELTVLYITQQPVGADKQPGQSHTFTVALGGGSGAALSYAWLKDGNPVADDPGHIAGAATPSLALTSLVDADAGAYQVQITQAGSTPLLSDAANLNVGGNPPVVASITPASDNVYVGEPASFVIEMQSGTGVNPLTYQWEFDNGSGYANKGGAADVTIAIASAALTDAGAYRCVVTDSNTPKAAQTRSQAASLGVFEHLTIVSPPLANATYTVGSQASPLVYKAGKGMLTVHYQWSKDGEEVEGATSSTFDFAAKSVVGFEDAGVYSCHVWDDGGDTFTSNDAVITVTGPLTITLDPVGGTVTEGHAFSLEADVAGGTAPYTYQWLRNGAPVTNNARITGANAKKLEFSTTVLADSGSYQLRATDSVTTQVTSLAAVMNVTRQVWIDVQPEGGSVRDGKPFTFTMHATAGTEPYHYLWLRSADGVIWDSVPGAPDDPELAFAAVTPADRAWYKVIVTDAIGDSAESQVVGLDVLAGVPAAGLFGLGLMSAMFALGGAVVVRRRK